MDEPKLFIVREPSSKKNIDSLAKDSLVNALEISKSAAAISSYEFCSDVERSNRDQAQNPVEHSATLLGQDLILFLLPETFVSPNTISLLVESRSDSYFMLVKELLPQAPRNEESMHLGDFGFLASFDLVQDVTGACCPGHVAPYLEHIRSDVKMSSLATMVFEQAGVYRSSVKYELEEISTWP